ncbi:MAG: Rne/Rng family ribonuclease [Bacteroidota bacterium]
MEKELIINSTLDEVEIAMLENGKLVELHSQEKNMQFNVGDIFLGRIKRLMPGLNAAFVEIGHSKDAFLHYTDLNPKLKSVAKFTKDSITGKLKTHRLDNFVIEPDINKGGRIDQVLDKKQPLLVQILKEPIGTKGPRLSCEITIPGRFLVLSPFTDVVAVSKKVKNAEERKRLKKIIESLKPKNFGVIVRTAAEGKNSAELHEELSRMMSNWEQIHDQLHKAKPPKKLLSELDKTTSLVRDVVSDSFNKIIVNDKELFGSIKNYMNSFSPDQSRIVQLHRGSRSVFDANGITRQIKSSFGKTPTMSSGAYIVIEHTEAMHVVDVNSGHKMSSKNQEDAVLAVNMEAAEEIARQLRLRDIGGIIIIDFIDMRTPDNKKKLQKAMRQYMANDRAQHTILPLSKFGLMQITRQRVRKETEVNVAEVCPTCKGSGKINPSILLTDEIERDLNLIMQARPKSKIYLKTHPFIDAFLKKGFPNKPMRWYLEHQKWIRIQSNNDFHLMEYKFFDDNEDEIRMREISTTTTDNHTD